jgi:signal transduction histidine kinase
MAKSRSMNGQPMCVLLVEDDSIDAELARWALAANASPPFVVDSAATLAQAMERVCNKTFDVVLLDLGLPDSLRSETLAHFRKACPQEIPIIVLTDQVDEQSAFELLNCGALDCIDKNDLTPILLSRSIRYTLLRQQLALKLKTTNDLLEEKNLRLSQLCDTAQQFVENVSHEFRTPLTVIREFTSIIRDGLDGPVTAKQEEHLNKVLHRTDDLASMIDDMLDISRFEAGLLGVWRRKCQAKDLIENVIGLLKSRAASKSVTLSANVPQNLAEVFCDEEKARRVIMNLMVNAIKFAPEGGRVDVWARHAKGQPDVAIGVSDNGPGICNENLEVIFERFQQGNQSLNTSTKGFGLGLNIARELVGLNLGKINVETKPNVGSTFSFTLPRFDARILFERLLDRLSFKERSTSDMSLFTVEVDLKKYRAATVVDEFLQRSVRANNLVMPGGNGSWVIAVACSEPDCERMIQHWITEWASYSRNSPQVSLPLLQITFRGSWSIADQREDVTEAFAELYGLSRDDPRATPTILVVDDDLEVIRCLSIRLRSAGFQVLTASDGDEGVLAAHSRHPDAIVLDVRMPRKDGLAVLRELRDDPTMKNTPIIMLSASIHDQQKALKSGASFFVRKPYDAEEVLSAIETSFREHAS